MSKRNTHLWCQPFCELLCGDYNCDGWFLQRCDGQREGTPGMQDAAVCSCKLQVCQVQQCSLPVIPDLQSPSKSLQKKQVVQRSPDLAAH